VGPRLLAWALSVKLHAAGALAAALVAVLFHALPEDGPHAERLRSRASDSELTPLPRAPSLGYRPREQGSVPEFGIDPDRKEQGGRMKGTDPDFVSDKPFQGLGIYDAAGGGGGGGGRYGSTLGPDGRTLGTKRAGRTTRQDPGAIAQAVDWLLRHQRQDGSWTARADCGGRCRWETASAQGDVASTALGVLVLIETADVEDRARRIVQGAQWLLLSLGEAATPEERALGILGAARARRVADLVVADPLLRQAAAGLAANPEGGGWRLLAFRALDAAGVAAPESTEEELDGWLRGAARIPAEANFEAIHFAAAASFRESVPDPRLDLAERALRVRQLGSEAGCGRGAWDPDDGRGRAAATALNALTLHLLERIRRTSGAVRR
jgi:hypothetical protein